MSSVYQGKQYFQVSGPPSMWSPSSMQKREKGMRMEKERQRKGVLRL